MTKRINVLDYGYVRLVSYMQPADQAGYYKEPLSDGGPLSRDWTGDLEISRNARVSYDAPPRSKDKGLINYLLKNKHTSPFEAMVFTFEVKAPIFVFRQWHRHRTWSYNEVSARYTELPEEFYVPSADLIGKQSPDNKQMRVWADLGDNDTPNNEVAVERMRSAGVTAFRRYKYLIDELQVPRELARIVLPLSTYSYMFATVDLHNLFHFIRLRIHEHSQYEIRVYAEALLKLIEPLVPDAVEAFEKHG